MVPQHYCEKKLTPKLVLSVSLLRKSFFNCSYTEKESEYTSTSFPRIQTKEISQLKYYSSKLHPSFNLLEKSFQDSLFPR